MRVIAESTTDLDRALSLAIEMELENNDRFKNSHSKNIGFVGQENRKFNNKCPNNNNSCLFNNMNKIQIVIINLMSLIIDKILILNKTFRQITIIT